MKRLTMRPWPAMGVLLGLLALTAIAAVALMPPGAAAKGKPPSGEAATNNLSFPAIFPDGKPSSWVEVPTWSFAPVAADTVDPTLPAGCVTEDGVEAGTAVPLTTLCYYARQNLGVSEETGERLWVGDPGDEVLWWLQERSQNKWQVYDPVLDGALTVTAIDFGDLLESTASIKQKQVRTEVSLLQVADETLLTALDAKLFSDPTLAVADFGWANQPVFAAMRMSGAVPGTDQSIDEIQGGDYGPGAGVGAFAGTGKLIDPRTVKTDSATGTGFDATVYSTKARLVIQKIAGDATVPTWDAAADEWVSSSEAATVGKPVVDLSTADGSYTAEINAGGSLIYGYNWNTTTADGTGTYRVTFVLESGANTQFDSTTLLANPGNVNTAHVVPGADVGEAGLAYVDVSIVIGGGGGGGGGGHGGH